jgi:hypothetical protein
MCAEKAFIAAPLLIHPLSEETSPFLDKQTDLNRSQILHYERFFCVYACHDPQFPVKTGATEMMKQVLIASLCISL